MDSCARTGVAPNAMDIERGEDVRPADRDAEADVCSADVRDQSQHRGTVEIARHPAHPRRGSAVIHCHHLAPKDRKDCAAVDSAVNRIAARILPGN